jgi:hypothetical protein
MLGITACPERETRSAGKGDSVARSAHEGKLEFVGGSLRYQPLPWPRVAGPPGTPLRPVWAVGVIDGISGFKMNPASAQ